MSIRKNRTISTTQDLQDVITSVILRQHGIFNKTHLIKSVNKYLQGSIFFHKKIVEEMIDSTLQTLSQHKFSSIVDFNFYKLK